MAIAMDRLGDTRTVAGSVKGRALLARHRRGLDGPTPFTGRTCLPEDLPIPFHRETKGFRHRPQGVGHCRSAAPTEHDGSEGDRPLERSNR